MQSQHHASLPHVLLAQRRFLLKLSVERIHLLNRMTEELRPIHVLGRCQRWHGASDTLVHSRNVECRVQRGLGRLCLLDLGVDRGEDGLAGRIARRARLVFSAHRVGMREVERLVGVVDVGEVLLLLVAEPSAGWRNRIRVQRLSAHVDRRVEEKNEWMAKPAETNFREESETRSERVESRGLSREAKKADATVVNRYSLAGARWWVRVDSWRSRDSGRKKEGAPQGETKTSLKTRVWRGQEQEEKTPLARPGKAEWVCQSTFFYLGN